MAHVYLFDLYDQIDQRVETVEKEWSDLTPEQRETDRFLAGRRDALRELHTFISDNFHDKLPRKLRKNRREFKEIDFGDVNLVQNH